MSRAGSIAAAAVVAACALFHFAFALANFGLAADDEPLLTVPLGEGVLAALAAVALAVGAILLAKRRIEPAAWVALAGTAPLAVFFAFTVPEYSDPIFLFVSLVIPALAATTAAAARRLRARSRR
jgi:hypothetical protein